MADYLNKWFFFNLHWICMRQRNNAAVTSEFQLFSFQATLMTFQFFLPSLSEPSFVGSAYIQESLPRGNVVGDDDKIYFFFSEAGKEFDFFDNTIVSRIARVCKVSRQAFFSLQLLYYSTTGPLTDTWWSTSFPDGHLMKILLSSNPNPLRIIFMFWHGFTLIIIIE